MTSPSIPTLLSSRNYRWIIALSGTLGLFGALGLGRFSLGVMLPAMGEGPALSYGRMGVLSTANFCGYLAAVLCCGYLNRLLGSRVLIFSGLLLIALSMSLIGLTSSYGLVLLLYSLTGVGSALANIPVMALITVWFELQLRGRAAGLCVMGNGFGILISGKAVPAMNLLGQGWQLSWPVLGGVVGMIAVICLLLVRNKPVEAGKTQTVPQAGGRGDSQEEKNTRALYHCGALYFLFGFTYVIYVTFVVTSLVQDRGFSEQAAGSLWAMGGLLSIVSGPLFGYVSDRFGRKQGLTAVYTLQAMAYLSAAWTGSVLSIYFSIFSFSLAAFSVPTIMAALAGDFAGPERAASFFGYITFIFGIGQITGPAIAGIAAEYTGSFSVSFLVAAVLVGGAVVLSRLLPEKRS